VSRDEHSQQRSEWRNGPGDPGYRLLQCATVLAEVWTFLDGECTDETRAMLCRHLETCSSCLHQYSLQGRIKNLIANRCGGDTAARRLRWTGPMRNGGHDER
jgi:mycothiol system anti-sigma-R factor